MTTQRSERIAEAIKRVVSEMLMRRIKDARITGMVSVTDVEVSGDLRHAKVFVSVYGDPLVQQQTMTGLASAKGVIRTEVGRQLGLRSTPDLVFKQDKTAERAAHINALLQQIQSETDTSSSESASSESVSG
ncbi:MAG: 30S ribosome-binding factor RbfA [Cyanobacteria bacterium REEB65]|nr:30S ribosome-binding factor RbfA [Cyanobacteria bacterium REEB65]